MSQINLKITNKIITQIACNNVLNIPVNGPWLHKGLQLVAHGVALVLSHTTGTQPKQPKTIKKDFPSYMTQHIRYI